MCPLAPGLQQHSIQLKDLPTDAAAAPKRMGGIAKTRKTKAAATLMSLAVVKEEAAMVLWWRH